MPMYYFHLRNKDTLHDTDGTELPDLTAAREYATNVARELMFRSDSIMERGWSDWTMSVSDHSGAELFSFELSGISNGNPD